MKKEELLALGLSEEQANQVFALNGRDVTKVKESLAAKEAELTAASGTIAELQEAVKRFDGVDVEQLRGDLAALQEKYDKDLARTRLDAAVDVALIGAGARDALAVRPFLQLESLRLEGERIDGLEGQVAGLKKEKSYLFEPEPEYAPPAGGAPNAVGNLRDAIAEKYQ